MEGKPVPDKLHSYPRRVSQGPWKLSAENLKQLDDLQRWLGCGRSEAVRTAIRYAVALKGARA